MVRPAAAFRHTGMDRFARLDREEYLDEDLSALAKRLKIDTSRPGFLKLRVQDIEWVTAASASAVRTAPAKNDARQAEHEPLHRFSSAARRSGWSRRSTGWRSSASGDSSSKRSAEGPRVLQDHGQVQERSLGPNPCVFLPDDRTIVFDEEEVIRKMAGGEDPARRPSSAGRTGSGPAAAWSPSPSTTRTTHSRNTTTSAGRMTRWSCRSSRASTTGSSASTTPTRSSCTPTRPAAVATPARRSADQLDSLIKLGRQSVEQLDPKSPDVGAHELIVRMVKAMAANVRVEHTDNAVSVQTQDFGTLADFAAIVEGEAQEPKVRVAARKDAKNSVKR